MTLCLGIVLMMPCGGYAPNRLDPNESGPPVLFNSLHPDGIKNENGKLLHGAATSLSTSSDDGNISAALTSSEIGSSSISSTKSSPTKGGKTERVYGVRYDPVEGSDLWKDGHDH